MLVHHWQHVLPEHGSWVQLHFERTGWQVLFVLISLSEERKDEVVRHVLEHFEEIKSVEFASLHDFHARLFCTFTAEGDIWARAHQSDELVDIQLAVAIVIKLQQQFKQILARDIHTLFKHDRI